MVQKGLVLLKRNFFYRKRVSYWGKSHLLVKKIQFMMQKWHFLVKERRFFRTFNFLQAHELLGQSLC